MKAFVIKNKNGEYIKEVGDDFYEAEPTRDISLALIYDENEMNIMKEAYPEYDYVEITIAEGDLEQENKQLKERIHNILEGKEIPAICAKKYEEYEEQLQEQIDYKEEYYHYWQEIKKELAIREKALELACIKLLKNEFRSNVNVIESLQNDFIEQAKEKLK